MQKFNFKLIALLLAIGVFILAAFAPSTLITEAQGETSCDPTLDPATAEKCLAQESSSVDRGVVDILCDLTLGTQIDPKCSEEIHSQSQVDGGGPGTVYSQVEDPTQ